MAALDIHHVAIKTADLEQTVRFYTDILGARQVQRPEFDFPGAWLNLGSTMFHLYAGKAAVRPDGSVPMGSAAVDHVAITASDFDGMRRLMQARGLDWREFDVPSFGLWQLFVHDPNGVLIELNFKAASEPAGAKGPDGTRRYIPGAF